MTEKKDKMINLKGASSTAKLGMVLYRKTFLLQAAL